MRNITFVSQNFTLGGSVVAARDPQPLAFLMIQGWGGHQNIEAAEALASLGFTTMTYDMRGNGASSGTLADFSRKDFLIDAVAAYDYLRRQVGENVAIGAIGSSFGSYMSILLSERRPLVCMSLRVPAAYPDEDFEEPQLAQVTSARLAKWRTRPVVGKNRAIDALHAFTGYTQIIEAEHDETIPHEAVRNYVKSISEKELLSFSLMRGAPHRLENDELRAEYIDLLTAWVVSLPLVHA